MSEKYKAILNTKEWQDRSHFIKTRDNLKCQAADCNTPKSILQVHHLDYFNVHNPWDYPDDMLITLCSSCHKKENYRYRFEQNLLTALKIKGFLASDLCALTALIYTDHKFLDNIKNNLRRMQNG